ncbi:MAG TPA: hypothetical protein VMI31_12510, partial [Fimbriimonadaceae bacterium]|nr:hypothetical protein [Fimbriimonadaceae bacterium]
MKIVLWAPGVTVALACVGFGLRTAGKPSSSVRANSRFTFTAKPEGSGAEAATVYALSENQRNGENREVWMVRLDEQSSATWLTPNGAVWVWAVTPGRGAHIWCRSPQGNQIAEVDTADVPGLTAEEAKAIDESKTTALDLGSGAEQLRLVTRSGDEIRVSSAVGYEGSPFVRKFAGLSGKDAFTDLLNTPGAEPPAEQPVVNGKFGVWPAYNLPFHNVELAYRNRPSCKLILSERVNVGYP